MNSKNYKGLLSYDQLVELKLDGVIDCPLENINGSSIDLTIADEYLCEENYNLEQGEAIDLTNESIDFYQSNFTEYPFIKVGEFILASTVECVNLPLNISALLMLKSSIGRNGLEHMNAGWIDAGFKGHITLEFKNMTRYHDLKITTGMKIVQMAFFAHDYVPSSESYQNKGRYMNQMQAEISKGVK